jgi:hypothetical protein
MVLIAEGAEEARELSVEFSDGQTIRRMTGVASKSAAVPPYSGLEVGFTR